MGLVFTDRPIVYNTSIDGSSKASLIAGIHAVLSGAGWSSSTYSTGYVYTITSPQGLAAKLRIWDPNAGGGAANQISLQMCTLDETLVGYEHRIAAVGGRTYQLWCNRCSVWISVPGVTFFTNNFGAFVGGIPYVYGRYQETSCEVTLPGFDIIYQAWFSCSDETLSFNNSRHFRNAYYNTTFSNLLNTLLVTRSEAAFRQQSMLQLCTLKYPNNFNLSIGGTAMLEGIQWYGSAVDGSSPVPVWYEPLLMFSSGETIDASIIGQLYDVALMAWWSLPEEEFDTYDSTSLKTLSWINYSRVPALYGYEDMKYFSLMLLKALPEGGGLGNYVY